MGSRSISEREGVSQSLSSGFPEKADCVRQLRSSGLYCLAGTAKPVGII
jgi:hypothetical protein